MPFFCSKGACQRRSQFSSLAFKIMHTLIPPNLLLDVLLTSFFCTLNIYSSDCIQLSGVQVLFFFSYSKVAQFPLPRNSLQILHSPKSYLAFTLLPLLFGLKKMLSFPGSVNQSISKPLIWS